MIPYEAIIQGDTNDSRFEKFCQTLLEKTQGIQLVGTSVTYDFGREATSLRRAAGTHAEIVCCTLNKDLDTKVVADAKRLAETETAPGHVFYCCSLPLTEASRTRLQAISGCTSP